MYQVDKIINYINNKIYIGYAEPFLFAIYRAENLNIFLQQSYFSLILAVKSICATYNGEKFSENIEKENLNLYKRHMFIRGLSGLLVYKTTITDVL